MIVLGVIIGLLIAQVIVQQYTIHQHQRSIDNIIKFQDSQLNINASFQRTLDRGV